MDLDSKVKPVKESAVASEVAQSACGNTKIIEPQKIHVGVTPCPKQGQHPSQLQPLVPLVL